MNSLLAARLPRVALMVASLLLTGSTARAITISASVAMPPLNFSNIQFTETNPTFYDYVGTTPTVPLALDFSSQSYTSILSLDSLNITLSFYNLDTLSSDTDFNNITLTLAGIDTGIKLNGYGNAGSTNSFLGAPINGAAILAALNSNSGILTMGLLDVTASPSNPFWFNGGIASLDLTDSTSPVPFTPSESMGLLVMAAASAWVRWRRRSPPVAA
jgi:hypothetical protein